MSRSIAWFLSAFLVATPAWADEPAQKKAPLVVFVTGDEEYRSEESMPILAKILEKQHGFRTKVCYALAADGTINPERLDHIEGLEALKDADLMVMFTRFRALPDNELQMILEYTNSGRPMIGFRTTSHAFKYDKGANAQWNDKFGREVFGQRWIVHHGHEKGEFLTHVDPLDEAKDSPILRGIQPFDCPSWLYHVEGGKQEDTLFGDSKPLVKGKSLVSGYEKANKLDTYPIEQPVAWTKTHQGDKAEKPARVFFTTLGHPQDFKSEAMRKLVVNAVFWALGDEKSIPDGGCKADLEGEFNLSKPGNGGHVKNRKPE